MSSDGLNDVSRLQLVSRLPTLCSKWKQSSGLIQFYFFSREILKRVSALYNIIHRLLQFSPEESYEWNHLTCEWAHVYKDYPHWQVVSLPYVDINSLLLTRHPGGVSPVPLPRPTHTPQALYFSYFSSSNTLFSVVYLTFISKENKSQKNT